MQSFPFAQLSAELGFEIIRMAALPKLEETPATPRAYYSTAISLCSVSHRIRLATMPHLLHTVILSSAPHVLSFISSIILQRNLRQASSRLALDYTKLVRRFWSTECWEPVVDEAPDDPLNYDALYEIIRNVQSLGLNIRSQHLLYNGLASVNAHPIIDWKCHRLTFAGDFWRWIPIMSTPEGQVFLRQLTHLVLLIKDKCPVTEDERFVPLWLKNVPFNFMPSLTHLAFTVPVHLLPSPTPDAETYRSWILNENPSVRSVVKDLKICSIILEPRTDAWELAFLQGENEGIWRREHSCAEELNPCQ